MTTHEGGCPCTQKTLHHLCLFLWSNTFSLSILELNRWHFAWVINRNKLFRITGSHLIGGFNTSRRGASFSSSSFFGGRGVRGLVGQRVRKFALYPDTIWWCVGWGKQWSHCTCQTGPPYLRSLRANIAIADAGETFSGADGYQTCFQFATNLKQSFFLQCNKCWGQYNICWAINVNDHQEYLLC